jgi:hypothetical protein
MLINSLMRGTALLEAKRHTLQKLLKEPSFNNFSMCLFYVFYILPLHVSALAGHLQAEYTIILGSYFTDPLWLKQLPKLIMYSA